MSACNATASPCRSTASPWPASASRSPSCPTSATPTCGPRGGRRRRLHAAGAGQRVGAALRLGTAIAPVFTRGPATLALRGQPGRGRPRPGGHRDRRLLRRDRRALERPPVRPAAARVRDTARFLRAALAGAKVTERYETFAVDGFRLASSPTRRRTLLVAALRRGTLRLAGRESDGAILNWLSPATSASSPRTSRRRAGPGDRGPHLRRPDGRPRPGPCHRPPSPDHLPERACLPGLPRVAGPGEGGQGPDVGGVGGRRPPGRPGRHRRRRGRRPARPRPSGGLSRTGPAVRGGGGGPPRSWPCCRSGATSARPSVASAGRPGDARCRQQMRPASPLGGAGQDLRPASGSGPDHNHRERRPPWSLTVGRSGRPCRSPSCATPGPACRGSLAAVLGRPQSPLAPDGRRGLGRDPAPLLAELDADPTGIFWADLEAFIPRNCRTRWVALGHEAGLQVPAASHGSPACRLGPMSGVAPRVVQRGLAVTTGRVAAAGNWCLRMGDESAQLKRDPADPP